MNRMLKSQKEFSQFMKKNNERRGFRIIAFVGAVSFFLALVIGVGLNWKSLDKKKEKLNTNVNQEGSLGTISKQRELNTQAVGTTEKNTPGENLNQNEAGSLSQEEINSSLIKNPSSSGSVDGAGVPNNEPAPLSQEEINNMLRK